jgi:DNA-binding transcriptional MerR regulator
MNGRTNPLRVGELASATGISVRTLHHYDEIGLLSPSVRTDGGHRLYGRAEIERLGQIMSLRQLGFTLEQIGECLNNTDFSAGHLLELHMQRVADAIERQQQLYERLRRLHGRLGSAEEVSAEEFLQLIEVITMSEQYYTTEQLKEIRERAEQLGEEGRARVNREWAELIDAVRAEKAKGTPNDDPHVLELAAKWRELVNAFTGGNREIAERVMKVWQQESNIHGYDAAEMRELRAYIGFEQ